MPLRPIQKKALVLLITTLLVFITTATAQNYSLKKATITTTWLQSLGAFESVSLAMMPQAQFEFTAFGRPYSFLPAEGGSIHFGNAKYLSEHQCCNNTCSVYCDLTSDQTQTQLAAFPFQLKSLPSDATLQHTVYSNATVFAFHTTLHSASLFPNTYIRFAVVLIAPSTLIMGIEPNALLTTAMLENVFSGLVGAPEANFGPSPVNNAVLHGTTTVLFPNPEAYPPTRIISYPRSQYGGAANIFCAIGGNICGPSYFSDLTTPLNVPITTNSDLGCYRYHTSGFIMELVKQNGLNSPQESYPALNCQFSLMIEETQSRIIITPAIYDRTQDVFNCNIPASDAGGPIDLTQYTSMKIALASTESTPSTTQVYQPMPTWIPVDYKNDWSTTTLIKVNDQASDDYNRDTANLSFPLTTTPPNPFPFPITDPVSCQCRFIRYRSLPQANPTWFNPNEYGMSLDDQALLRPQSKIPTNPVFVSTITTPFQATSDYCYSDCAGAMATTGPNTANFNNCGQCLTITAAQVLNPTAKVNNQDLNCWNMCEPLTAYHAGHFSYLMYYPTSTARTNGLLIPNSPFHEVDEREISPTPIDGNAPVECATDTTQNAAGEPVGFTTYREHLSATLHPVDYFKYITLGIAVIGAGFAIFLMIQLARARERKRRRREEKNQQRLRGGRGVGVGTTAAGNSNNNNPQPQPTPIPNNNNSEPAPMPPGTPNTPAYDDSDDDGAGNRPPPQPPAQQPRTSTQQQQQQQPRQSQTQGQPRNSTQQRRSARGVRAPQPRPD